MLQRNKKMDEKETNSKGEIIDQEEEEADRMSILMVSVGILIVAAAMILILLIVLKPFGQAPSKESSSSSSELAGQITVPDIVGMTEDEAEALLSQHRLGIKYKGEEVSEEKEGIIIRQEPKAGEMAQENETVTYIRSSGAKVLMMPDVIDEALSDAAEELTEMGFDALRFEMVYSDEDFGCVIETNPKAEERSKSTDPITLTVSAGEKKGTVTCNLYVGMKEKAALKAAKADNLIVRLLYGQSDLVEEGAVMAQDLTPYSAVASGSVLTLTINRRQPSVAELSAGEEIVVNEPDTYGGNPLRFVLEQTVENVPYEVILEDDKDVTFPYTLSVPSVKGKSGGVIRVYEKKPEGYVPIAFWQLPE